MGTYHEARRIHEVGRRKLPRVMEQALAALTSEIFGEILSNYLRPKPQVDPELVIEAIKYTYQARCRRV